MEDGKGGVLTRQHSVLRRKQPGTQSLPAGNNVILYG